MFFNYDLNTKYTYSYDLSGNLLKKTLINLTNNDIIKEYNYSYTNSNWEDQLTTFDGNSITYDLIGNMASFDGANYTWTNGVELSLYSNNDNHTYVSYKYDDKGIRYYKNVNGTDVNYYTLNNDILYEIRGNNVLYYLYDSDGLIGFDYNNTRYYYIKNMHDDIIGIVNSNGTKIVSYTYDSWGNIISIKDTNNQEISQEDYTNIANINPFRYRSYYYDVETRLYYLNHRYYNPRINRFISPDIIIGSNRDILSYNLYSYIENNPLVNIDKDGYKKQKNKKKQAKKKKTNSIFSKAVAVAQTFLLADRIIKQAVTNAIVNTVSSIVSGVTNAINNSFYVDVGGGFGQVLGNTEFGVEATKTTGFEISKQEFKPYTSTSYGAYGGILGINREIRNYDAQNNPMTMPHEIYDSPNTVKSTTVFAKDQYIEVSKNEIDDNLFVGISIDATDLNISGPYFVVKVGFNIDVSWLPGYKSY